MKPAIFLDRDGTLNVDHGYTHKIEDYALHEGVISGLQLLSQYDLFITTNQSGVATQKFSEQQMIAFNNHLVSELSNDNITIKKVFYCPHHYDANCSCRKPKPGMIEQATKEYDLDLSTSYVIGDKPADIGLANNAGCKGILLLTGWGAKELEKSRLLKPDYIASNMLFAAQYITKKDPEKIVDLSTLLAKLNPIRTNKTIVTLNGAFDIIHNGHQKIIAEAKAQGDLLIVALNVDSTIKKNKGSDRPLNNQDKRALMMSSFSEVDYVLLFSEDTPIEILDQIKPHVHVNGSEYGKSCIEEPTVTKNGGKIHVVTLIEGLSTTNIIKKESAH